MKLRPDRVIRFCLLCVAALQLTGCGSHPASGGGTGGGGGTPATNLTGNWEFQVTPSGNIPFTRLSGFLNQATATSGASNAVTASLQVQSSQCFAQTKVLDLSGYIKDPYAQLVAFPSYAQTVTLNLSTVCTNVSLCGSYTVSGGCADGSAGDLVGVKYAQLAGTFNTATNVSPALQLTVTEAAQGTGQGSVQVSGKLTFSGASCVTSGTVDETQSYLSGSSLHLVATTSPLNAVLTMDGIINQAATTITLSNVSLAGGSCVNPLNGAVLK